LLAVLAGLWSRVWVSGLRRAQFGGLRRAGDAAERVVAGVGALAQAGDRAGAGLGIEGKGFAVVVIERARGGSIVVCPLLLCINARPDPSPRSQAEQGSGQQPPDLNGRASSDLALQR